MSNFFSILVTTPIIFFLYFNLFLSPVFADNLSDCPAFRNEPSQLFNDPSKTPKAKFFVTPSDKDTKYTSWKMQFESSVPQNVGPATLDTSTGEVWREIISGMFTKYDLLSPGPHTFMLIGITDKNEEIRQCRGHYSVTESDTQCTVKLSETTGITPTSNLEVSGENLTKDERFGVFIDGEIIKGSHLLDFVSTSNFSGVSIPNKYLSPNTSHIVSIRKQDSHIPLSASRPLFPIDYGSDLCKVTFSVGTPSAPGSVVTPGTAPVPGTPGLTGPPTTSGGIPCDTTDPENPGFQTAIGCVHTSPAAFIKDFLSFIIGISGGLAFLMMLLGAFQMLTSAGNPETLQAGRDRFQSAIIGLLMVIFAVLLLQIIGFDILRIPGFER